MVPVYGGGGVKFCGETFCGYLGFSFLTFTMKGTPTNENTHRNKKTQFAQTIPEQFMQNVTAFPFK